MRRQRGRRRRETGATERPPWTGRRDSSGKYGSRRRPVWSRPQWPAEATLDPGHDPRPQPGPVLVGGRPLGRAEGEPQRDGLAPGADLVAAVDVEDADVAELGAGGLADGVDEVACRHRLVDGEGQVLLQRGERRDVDVVRRA